jgi:hypothetical protein
MSLEAQVTNAVVPFADVKRGATDLYNLQAGANHAYNYFTGALTAEETATLQQRAEFHGYFGIHGKTAQDCAAIYHVAEEIDPARSLTIIEKYRYLPNENAIELRDGSPDTPEVAAKRVQAEELVNNTLVEIEANGATTVNSFVLMANYCRARRIPFVHADFDAFDVPLWDRTMGYSAPKMSSIGSVRLNFFNNISPSMPFYEAAMAYRDALVDANWNRQDGSTHMRQGELMNQRERVAANTSARTTLEQLKFHTSEEKLVVRVFFGGSHEAGTLTRFADLNLPMQAHVMTTYNGYQPTEKAADPSLLNAYTFARNYFWYETDDGRALGPYANHEDFGIAIREMPLPVLEAIYERHRARINWIYLSTNNPAIREAHFKEASGYVAQELSTAWQTSVTGPSGS